MNGVEWRRDGRRFLTSACYALEPIATFKGQMAYFSDIFADMYGSYVPAAMKSQAANARKVIPELYFICKLQAIVKGIIMYFGGSGRNDKLPGLCVANVKYGSMTERVCVWRIECDTASVGNSACVMQLLQPFTAVR